MIRSILVPLAGSPFGEQALPLAMEIARRAHAAVHLAHAHVPVTDAYTANELRVAWEEGGREVTESRRLAVRPGDHLTESFPAAVKGSGDHKRRPDDPVRPRTG
jgi:hypothetical protein